MQETDDDLLEIKELLRQLRDQQGQTGSDRIAREEVAAATRVDVRQ